jgi:hypothetical protein
MVCKAEKAELLLQWALTTQGDGRLRSGRTGRMIPSLSPEVKAERLRIIQRMEEVS